MTTPLPAGLEPLRQASEGLLFQSETDAPFTPFFWPDVQMNELTAELVRELAGAPADTTVESVSVRDFFENATTAQEWHNEEEAATVERFQALVKTLKSALRGEKVFRIGERKLECYIVGGVDGGCGGLKTVVVET